MKPIIAFAGSNSPHSINHQLLKAALRSLPARSVRLLSLTDFPAPIYGPCLEAEGQVPAPIRHLHAIFRQAAGFMIASPEHNGLPPAFFKNTLDWLSRIEPKIFGDKPMLLLSTSPGQNGGASNLRILAELMPQWGGQVVDRYSLPAFHHHYCPLRQTITDPARAAQLALSVQKFANAIPHDSHLIPQF
jgi:NAD(P)H-dependent FMN reductase